MLHACLGTRGAHCIRVTLFLCSSLEEGKKVVYSMNSFGGEKGQVSTRGSHFQAAAGGNGGERRGIGGLWRVRVVRQLRHRLAGSGWLAGTGDGSTLSLLALAAPPGPIFLDVHPVACLFLLLLPHHPPLLPFLDTPLFTTLPLPFLFLAKHSIALPNHLRSSFRYVSV